MIRDGRTRGLAGVGVTDEVGIGASGAGKRYSGTRVSVESIARDVVLGRILSELQLHGARLLNTGVLGQPTRRIRDTILAQRNFPACQVHMMLGPLRLVD